MYNLDVFEIPLENISPSELKGSKQPRYELSKKQLDIIKKDDKNCKAWDELLEFADSAGSVRIVLEYSSIFLHV